LIYESVNLPNIANITPIKEYIQWLSKTRKKAYEDYYYAFLKYARWLRKAKGVGKDITELTLADFRPDWVEEHYQSLENHHTANRFLAAVRGLLKFVKNVAPYSGFEDLLWLDRTIGAINMIKRRGESSRLSVGALELKDVAELILKATEEDELVYSSLLLFLYTGARASELARDYVSAKIDLSNVDAVVKEVGDSIVDFRKNLMVIPIAKSDGKYRVIPFKPIKDAVKVWFDGLKEVVRYCRSKGRFWYYHRFKAIAKKCGIDLRVHDLRRTVKTYLEFLPVKPWEINYWIGHVVRWDRVESKYRDIRYLLPKIYSDLVYSKEEVICPKCYRVYAVGDVEDVCPACRVELTHSKHFLLRVLEGRVY